ncbi:MAG: hypothetical protein PGN15_15435, partial [Aeromicrobium erythreum]
MRGRCGLRARADRLRLHGRRLLADVRDRSRRHQGCHRRADLPGPARRCAGPLRDVGGRPRLLRRRAHLPGGGAVPGVDAAAEQLQPADPVRAGGPVDRESPELLDLVPTSPTASYDMRDVIECLVDDGELFEVHAHWARNIVCCLARMGGRVVGDRREPAAGAGRRARHRRLGQGGPVRADVRLLPDPAAHPRRRPRLPPRRAPGAPRPDPARREAALRLLQRHRPPGLGVVRKALRRRVHRDGLPVGRRGRRTGLADERGRGHGPRRRGQRHLPARDRGGRRRRRRAAAPGGAVPRGVHAPLLRRRAWPRGGRDRPGAHAADRHRLLPLARRRDGARGVGLRTREPADMSEVVFMFPGQ